MALSQGFAISGQSGSGGTTDGSQAIDTPALLIGPVSTPPAMPSVIVYTARALNKAETQRLEAYTQAIILKEGASTERLVNEILSLPISAGHTEAEIDQVVAATRSFFKA